jgi:hypothetical protein
MAETAMLQEETHTYGGGPAPAESLNIPKE